MCPYLLDWTTGHHNFMQKSHFLYYNGKGSIINICNNSINYQQSKESDRYLPTDNMPQQHGSIASLHRHSNPLP